MLKQIWSNTDINLQIPTKKRPTEEERQKAEMEIERVGRDLDKRLEAVLLALAKKMREKQEHEQQSQPPQP